MVKLNRSSIVKYLARAVKGVGLGPTAKQRVGSNPTDTIFNYLIKFLIDKKYDKYKYKKVLLHYCFYFSVINSLL